MKRVIRTQTYQDDLDAIETRIAKDDPGAGIDMWFHIDDQVSLLADPNFRASGAALRVRSNWWHIPITL